MWVRRTAPRRFRAWWLAAMVMVVLLSACGSSSSESANSAPAGSGATGNAPAGIAAGGAAPVQRPATGGATTADSTGLGNTSASVTNPQTGGESKIIRTATISLSVKDVPGTMNAIWNAATDLGGFVVSSSAQGTGDDARGEVTLRVPAAQYNATMERLRGYGVKVLNEKSTAQDVSEEYVDLKARQRTLELTVMQLQTLLGQAKTVDDTLKVQVQLNSVQTDLERVRGRITFYDNRAAFSTITASLITPAAANGTNTNRSFGDSLATAWHNSLTGLQSFIELLVTFWWLILLAVLAIPLWRRFVRRPSRGPVAVRNPAPPFVPPAPPTPPAPPPVAPAAPAAS